MIVADRLNGDGILTDNLRPGSREFLAVLDELKSLHLKKTLDYGIDEDALSNIRSSADVVNMPPWAGASCESATRCTGSRRFSGAARWNSTGWKTP